MSAGRPDETEVAALLRQGRHEEIAERLAAAGDLVGAADLYAAVWRHGEAIALAERAGRPDEAYRHALVAGDASVLDRLRVVLVQTPELALRAAAHAEARGRLTDAAELFAAAGDLRRAAELYASAGEHGLAGRALEAEGELREAGRAYERRLREVPDDVETALRLGLILVRFGRFEPAARVLQAASRHAPTDAELLRLLVACLDALGMEHAAGATLARLRALDPGVPHTVGELLERCFGDRRGLRAPGVFPGPRGGAPDEMGAQWLAGRYRIVRELGAGATGRVVLAHDAFHDRDVAIKLLDVAGSGRGRDAFVRFAREARIAAALDHPHVVRVFEFDAAGPFLVMEFMAGGTLEDRLGVAGAAQGGVGGAPVARASIGLSAEAVRDVMLGVLDGLGAAHRLGVVHRDLKPANVFFDAAGTVKIGDFGVAHLADLGSTMTGAMLGTLAYMAPEQITGGAPPTAATDLYALGVILHRLLAGALPFPGPDFVQQHLDEPPPPLRAFRPDIDERLERLVLDLLAKRPADRPQETAEVAARLRAVRWSQGGEALRDALRLGGTAGARIDGHGIPAAREGVGGGAEPEPGALASAAHPEEGAPNERFVPAAPPADGGEYPALAPFETALLEHDRALGRLCWRVPCDERRAAFVRACAAADHPHLQAVYDVDPEAGFARLEAPRAATLRALGVRAPRDLPTTLSAAARAQIAAALDALHVAGIAHGRVDADHVAIGPTRAVLLLPADHDPCASREADLAALDALARGG